jgi:hypothetical protein
MRIRSPRHALNIGALLILIFIFCPSTAHAARTRPIPVKTEHARPPEIKNWNLTAGQWNKGAEPQFLAFDKTAEGGGNLASGDVNGDGQLEIIVAAGKGNQPLVRIFSNDGKLLKSFFAYAQGFRGGVSVAVGDTDADGKAEIITAPGPGAEAKIHIFNANGTHKLKGGALAYDPRFLGGAHVVAADLNRDDKAEIITSPEPGGEPHVRIWDGQMQNLSLDFFAFDKQMTDGVTLTIIQTPNGPNIVTAIESWNLPLVRNYQIDFLARAVVRQNEFLAFDQTSKSGVTLATHDFNHDGADEIAAARNGGDWPEVRLFNRRGDLLSKFLPLDKDYRGALSLTQFNSQLLVMPLAPVIVGPTDKNRVIDVDLSEQRLYAYEHGRIAKSFLVSTGVARHPTPIISTTVQRKVPINVKYNLEITSHYYIHCAYWHNNFGYRMSHGCVNTSLQDAEWIYNWSEVGTPVEVHE